MKMTKEDGALDLASLTVEPATLKPVPKGKAAEPNPLVDHLEKTWDEEKSFRVPASRARSLEAKLRKTAMRMGFGVTVQFQVGPEDAYISGAKVEKLDPVEPIRVVFQIHEKSQYKGSEYEGDYPRPGSGYREDRSKAGRDESDETD